MVTPVARFFTLGSLLLGALLLLALFFHSAKPAYTIHANHANGIYAPDEKVAWTVDVAGNRTGQNAVRYQVSRDGAEIAMQGTLDLSNGPATITCSGNEPGVLLAQIVSAASRKPPLAVGGAVVAPDKIAPAAPAPDDFAAFWQGKLKELASVPINPVVQKVDIGALAQTDGVVYDKVTLDNIRGTHVYGQLSRPAKGDKFPAMLVLPSAGVYPLDKMQVIDQAKLGWLVLNISAHDLPIDAAPSYYKNLAKTTLQNYFLIGSEDREDSYFLRMFLGCVRAIDYLSSRPDWDGKVLVVTGYSQGGLQSFAAAALCPQVTAAMVLAPAGCDVDAPLAHPPRASSWPYWFAPWGPKDRDMKKVRTTAGYFDGANFAARMHCPTLIGVGLLDDVARPAGVIAAFNNIQASKKLIILPESDHYSTAIKQAAYYDCFNLWLAALKQGLPPPAP